MDLVFSRTKKIPTNRFGRECGLCSSRHGVPIECSARGCKAAYHTTCAIRGKLKMQAIFGKNYKGGIKLRSYCKDHTPTVKLESGLSGQADTIDANGVKEIDMTNLADDRLQESNEELDYFWKYVDINEVHKKILESYARRDSLQSGDSCTGNFTESTPKKKKISAMTEETKQNNSPKKDKIKGLNQDSMKTSVELIAHREVDPLVIDLIYRYWMLLRTANNGQSLIKFSPSALKEREFEQRKSIMRLRIELERVRNLSYMIGKREKLKSSWLKAHQNIIKRTLSIIDDLNPVTETNQMIETPSCPDNNNSSANNTNRPSNNPHNHISTTNHHRHSHHHLQTSNKKSLHQTQHLQPTNGMFDESDQLINDLLTCDQIYELPNSSSHTNSNFNNLSYQERCTLEGRRTLSLVRRINRQLKNICHEPSLNPYAKSYLVPKRSDSPMGTIVTSTTTAHHHSANKILKYR